MSIIELLEYLQWRHDKNPMSCPFCHEALKYGHSQDCEISRRINQLKAAEQFGGIVFYDSKHSHSKFYWRRGDFLF